MTQATVLHSIGIACIPLCRPMAGEACTASWHNRPCGKRGKHPLVKGFPAFAHQLPALEPSIYDFRRHFPCNVGMVVPAGRVVVEADSPDAEFELSEISDGAVEFAPARERREGRGRGYVFSIEAGAVIARTTGRGESQAIDILPAGSIFVLPPSVHKTGHRNTWVPGREPWVLPAPALPPRIFALAPPRIERTVAGKTRSSAPKVVVAGFQPRISPRVSFLLKANRKLATLWLGSGKTRGDQSPSGIDFAIAIALHRHHVPVIEIAEALAARPGDHNTDPAYCFRTAEKVGGRR